MSLSSSSAPSRAARGRSAVGGLKATLQWAVLRASVPLQRVAGGGQRGMFGILLYHRVVNPPRGVGAPTYNVAPDRYLGQQNSAEVLSLVGDAACLVVPPHCYEGFPRTILEAFAKGTPVVASRLGAMTELIQHDHNGVHVQPGDARELALAVEKPFARPDRLAAMRPAARSTYTENYTAAPNYHAMMSVYDLAIRHQQLRQVPRSEECVQLSTERIAS